MEKGLLEKLVEILVDQNFELKKDLSITKSTRDYWSERADAQSRENAAIREELAELKAIVGTGKHLTDDNKKEDVKK